MLAYLVVCVMIFAGCGQSESGDSENEIPQNDNTQTAVDSSDNSGRDTLSQVYENDIFRGVRAQKTADHTFRITGEARVFEGQFNWVVEDGHYQLKKGTAKASQEAPDWGHFSFSVEIQKKDPNTTLHLVLYDSSPKGNITRNELPVLLY